MPPRLERIDPNRPPLRWLLRFPLHLYRARLGWLLGKRFVRLTTRGRRSGLPRSVVLEILGRDPATGALVIASGWGERSQWLRNVEADPRARVEVGVKSFTAEVVRLSAAEGEAQLRAYARRHRFAYRLLIGPLVLGHRPSGSDHEFAEVARAIPILLLMRTSSPDRTSTPS